MDAGALRERTGGPLSRLESQQSDGADGRIAREHRAEERLGDRALGEEGLGGAYRGLDRGLGERDSGARAGGLIEGLESGTRGRCGADSR